MRFSNFLKTIKSAKPSKPVDAYAMVNGHPSNESICEDMLSDKKESTEATSYVQELGKTMGFSESDSKLFW